jgi:hypothetical protein
MTTPYVLPTADTNCFDEDTKTDCWSFSRDLLLQEIAKAELRGREARPVCLWNNVDGCWETTCGNAFEINDGTPAENNMTHCCYCGGKVEEDIK